MHYIDEIKKVVFEQKKITAYLCDLTKEIEKRAYQSLSKRLIGLKFVSEKVIYEILDITIYYFPQEFNESKNAMISIYIISTQPTSIHSAEMLIKIKKDFKSHGEFRKSDKSSIIPLWGNLNFDVNIRECFDETYFFDLKLI